jgi:hypothetical protein
MATETEEINIGEKEATDIAVAEAEKKAEKERESNRIPLFERNTIQSFLMERFGLQHNIHTHLDIDWPTKYGDEISKIIDSPKNNKTIRPLIMLLGEKKIIGCIKKMQELKDEEQELWSKGMKIETDEERKVNDEKMKQIEKEMEDLEKLIKLGEKRKIDAGIEVVKALINDGFNEKEVLDVLKQLEKEKNQ